MPNWTILAFLFLAPAGLAGALDISFQGPEASANGFTSYTLESPFQSRATCVEILTPDKMKPGKQYPVLYLLPVNDGVMGAWGSGIVEAKRHDIHNRYEVICVSPEYDYTPWYGDHPTDPALAQESYLMKAVIPMIEAHFPVLNAPEGRILLGFSKSGFGAISMALRNPDKIGKAAAWDAPVTMTAYFEGEEEMVRVFQTPKNFDPYCIPALVEKHAAELQNRPPRIFLLSNANPNDSITALHTLLEGKGVPHRYAIDEKREHTWTSGWLPALAGLIFPDE